MVYVYSTLTSAMVYTFYRKLDGVGNVVEHEVRIEGGANLADKNVITPRGVMTAISEDDAALLKDHPVYKMHNANGFVTIEDRKYDIERVVSDLTSKDASAPIVPQDFLDSDSGAKPIEVVSKKGK